MLEIKIYFVNSFPSAVMTKAVNTKVMSRMVQSSLQREADRAMGCFIHVQRLHVGLYGAIANG